MAKKRDLESGSNPPNALPVNLDGIPEELRGCAQWVLWRYERRTDNRGRHKWTKVPIRFDNRQHASSTDPDSWCEFETLSRYYDRKRSDWPGIGFNFHADDPFCGIDLDDCRDARTGEIAAWAIDIIARLGSYAEVSPSGTGVKIILQGQVPGGRRRGKWQSGEFEVYDCGRFFTITGIHFDGTPASVNEAQDALDAICAEVFAAADAEAPPVTPLTPPPVPLDISDAQLVERMFASHAGAALERLWLGDLSANEDDHSRADMSLCAHLAWWARGDVATVDRLFRLSGLYRKKWDEQRGDRTYGQRTIAAALRGLGRGYDPQYRATQQAAAQQQQTQQATQQVASVSPAALAIFTPPVADGDGPATPAPPVVNPPGQPHRLQNYDQAPGPIVNGRQTFVVRGLSAAEIAGPLLRATGNWPRRVGEQLFVRHATKGFHFLKNTNALFAWASRHIGQGVGGNPVDWMTRGSDLLTKSEFFEDLTTTTTAYEAVELYPHEPPIRDVYYCDRPTCGGDGQAVERFLGFFCPASDTDRQLLLALLLTSCWGGPAGQRPAFAFVSAEGGRIAGPGSGKTTMAQQVAELWGGFIKVRVDDDFSEVQRRILSPTSAGKRFCLVDNVKESKLSVADLEDMITCNRISGRQMYVGEGDRPNYFTWLMTYNGVQLSSDLAQRSVIIQMQRPRLYGQWARQVEAFIREHRHAVFGDLIAMLRQPVPELKPATRWAIWESEVLAHVACVGQCQDTIRARQGESNDDVDAMELVREEFANVLRRNSYTPSRAVVFFTSNQAVLIASRARMGRFGTCDSPMRLNRLGVPELQKKNRAHARGFLWVGQDAAWVKGDHMPWFYPTHPADDMLKLEDGIAIPDEGEF